MTDPLDPPEGEPAAAQDGGGDPAGAEQEGPWPWEAELPDDPAAAGDPDAPRQRHDAFTDARKRDFLRALVKAGCLQDACRRVGVSPATVYRHQQDDPRFLEHCLVAIRMRATPLELTAWQRAVDGVEQEFACGGQVHVRRRYDSSLLRLLLQGSNPKKYGPNPGYTRKRMLRHERKQMEREIRADIDAQIKLHERPFEEAVDSVLAKIEAIERHEEPKKLAAGWTKSADGHWVPPGYVWVGGVPGADSAGTSEQDGAGEGQGGTPRDSV